MLILDGLIPSGTVFKKTHFKGKQREIMDAAIKGT